MKHIYILGAGASNESAGAPLGAELVWDYYRDCAGVSELDENNKTTNRECEERMKKFDGSFGKFLRVVDHYFDLHEYRKWVEAVNSGDGYIHPASWGNKKYYIDEVLGILGEKKDGDNISLVKRLISEHITEKTNSERNDEYRKFIERLPNNSVLMTTNFDSCLVTAGSNLSGKVMGELLGGLAPTLCVGGAHEGPGHRSHAERGNERGIPLITHRLPGKTYFDCIVDFDFVDRNARYFYYKKGGQTLIKLNGSLDWLMCKKCKKLGLFVPCRNYDSQRCCITDHCDGVLESFIVLPHQEHHDKMEKLWNIAREELQKATHVTIIGYSFPKYDAEVARLFKEKTNEKAQVQVVGYYDDQDRKQYKKETEERVQSIFTKQSLRVYVDGFGKYIESTLLREGES